MNKISLLTNITDEQLLEFCLDHIAKCDSDQEPHPIAEKIITTYAINEVAKKGEFTEDDVITKYRELVVDHILTNMVHDGLIEADFSDDETKYVLSEEGRKYVRKDD